MKLSSKYKKDINNEFDHVIKKMEESKNATEILYYLSGIQSILHRIFNFEYSKDLLFSWFVIDRVYKDLYGLWDIIGKGELIPTFPEDFGSQLVGALTEIKNSFFGEEDERVGALKNYVELMYRCTGNGFYLSSKGIIKEFPGETKLKDSEKII